MKKKNPINVPISGAWTMLSLRKLFVSFLDYTESETHKILLPLFYLASKVFNGPVQARRKEDQPKTSREQ